MFDVMSFISTLEKECSDFKRSLNDIDAEEQIDIIKLACSHVYPEDRMIEEFHQSKKDNKSLVIKFGMDPMDTNTMVDHMVPMVLLSKLQRMGHKIVFLIGDFTALIGDPSDSSIKQRKLNKKKIESNVKGLKKDLSRFIEFAKTDILYNSSWLNEIKLPDLLETMLKLEVSLTLKREDFRKKLINDEDITYAELIYSFIMGIDSLHIKPDLELGREDQLDNLNMCRRMMEAKEMKPEVIMTTYALPQGNLFSIDEDPVEIFNKIGKLDDRYVLLWYKLLTEITPKTALELENAINNSHINMQTIKEVLARIIVTKLYGEEKSNLAYIEYIKGIVKNAPTKEIRMIHGSKMSIGEFLAASTDFTLPEAEDIVRTAGARALSCDGGCLTYILNSDADISSIFFDKFYIIMGDKLVLRITK